jgi:glycerol-3-phosphate dehydrogenase
VDPNFLQPIEPLPGLWAELAWAAENEAVVHLDDLLLRRVRLGLLLPKGGMDKMDQVRNLVQSPLGWSDDTWLSEVIRYKAIWQENYSLPGKA